MPELPEVHTIVEGLNKHVKGRKIVGIWTDWPKYFKLPNGGRLPVERQESAFKSHIIGKKILGVARRAKNILFRLSDSHLMLIHQKMSGHLIVGKWTKATSDKDYQPLGNEELI